MTSKNKLLTILSEIEQYALYGLPDFDEGQQFEYLSLSETELALACSRPGSVAKTVCGLIDASVNIQIGGFHTKPQNFRRHPSNPCQLGV